MTVPTDTVTSFASERQSQGSPTLLRRLYRVVIATLSLLVLLVSGYGWLTGLVY